jgi:hypothetical protein
MSDILNTSPQRLENGILDKLDFIASIHDINLDKTDDYVSKFSKLIYKMHKNKDKKEVIVLIDEYDAPIIDNINNTELADENRKILQNFYNVLKNSEKYIKFVFITGISKLDKIFDFVGLENQRFSKFTKTSIFSKFNNLTELTLDKDYSIICGITHKELKKYYSDHIQVLADENNYGFDEVLERINYFYDSYS